MSRTRIEAFRDAANGLRHAARTQVNVRLHLAAAAAALALSLALGLRGGELALIVFAIGLVLVAELLNSALEATVDLVTQRPHPLARAAKDMAAGAVLVAAGAALACALLVLLPRLRAALGLLPGGAR